MANAGEQTPTDRHISGTMRGHVQIALNRVEDFQLGKFAAIALR
jgi:hypothetical protein